MAVYPNATAVFTYKVDNQDKVVAADVNILYDEVTEIEKQLGAGGVATSATWGSGTLTTSTVDWYNNGGLRARLQNIENGIYVLTQSIDGGTP